MSEDTAAPRTRKPHELEQQPCILVVDDEIPICDVLNQFLSGFGYRVFACSNPHQALELLSHKKIDLVLTDLQMGDISGVDILRAAQQFQSDAAVILVTGYPTVENAVQVLKEGAYDYVTKPFRLDELGKVVQRGLERQRLSREVVSLRETVALYQISEAMNSSLELTRVLQMILNSAISEAQSDNGCIILVDQRNKRLVLAAARGELPPGCDQIGQLKPERVHQWAKFHEQFQQAVQPTSQENGFAGRCRKYLIDSNLPCPFSGNSGEDLASLCIPLRARDQVIGVLHVSRSYRVRRYEERELKALTILASSAARAIENARLYDDLHHDYLNVIKALANAVEAKDPYTRGHSDRVVRYTQAIGSGFRLSVADLEKLEVASILHDVGKIGISDQILLKPGGLTAEEYMLMKQHPIIGDRILRPIDSLEQVRKWIYQHHERHDGLGYPEGVKGEEIDFHSHILIVAEVFDALATERAYKKAWPMSTVVDYLRDHSGTHFHPEVVSVFTDILNRQGDNLTTFTQSGPFRILSPDDLMGFFQDRAEG